MNRLAERKSIMASTTPNPLAGLSAVELVAIRLDCIVTGTSVTCLSSKRNDFDGYDLPTASGNVLRIFPDDTAIRVLLLSGNLCVMEWEANFTETTPRDMIVAFVNAAVTS